MGNVLKIRDEYRQIQWAAAIQECKASGLTNKEYCIQHGLSEKSFYYCKRSFAHRSETQFRSWFPWKDLRHRPGSCAFDIVGQNQHFRSR